MTPWPPLGPIAELGRLRLAISFRTDSTAVFLEKVSQELAFWRMTLREAQLLGTKMSALAGIRWANDFLSTLMRRLETPIQFLLEACRPVAFIGTQAIRVLRPLAVHFDNTWNSPIATLQPAASGSTAACSIPSGRGDV